MPQERHYGSGSNAVPLWLISPDSRFREHTTECLIKIESFRFMGAYAKWQSAIPVLRTCNSNSSHIVLVDEDPKTRDGAGCLSFLEDATCAFSVIVLMSDTSDENILSALSHRVSGFLVKPTSDSEIIAAIETVIRGGVWMKRPVLERITCLIPCAMLKKSLSLTYREQEIVNLAVNGYSTQGIAEKLNISYYTVDTHIKNIYQKLKVNNRSSLVALVLQNKTV